MLTEHDALARKLYIAIWLNGDERNNVDHLKAIFGPNKSDDYQHYGAQARKAVSIIRTTDAARIAALESALEPFAKIVPSSLYSPDVCENEEYVVTLKRDYGNPAEFTGADLARARATLRSNTNDR